VQDDRELGVGVEPLIVVDDPPPYVARDGPAGTVEG
jgi:hypothetical protein